MVGKKRPGAEAEHNATQRRRSSRFEGAAAVVKTEELIEVKTEVKAEEEGYCSGGMVAMKEVKVMLLGKQKKMVVTSPFASSVRPTAEECIAARDALAAMHGEPSREKKESCVLEGERSATLLEKRAQSVLDSLVRTILSQNTTDTLSKKAFESLKKSFPTYKAVLAAPPSAVEESIKTGGLAAIKVARIRFILETVLQERPHDCLDGEPSLEYLREMETEAVKAHLSRFKGVGPKTISCVLMFTLARPEFPVDTHVWHIAKRLGWVPNSASREDTYLHLNQRVPDAIKYDLHVLMVGHGKVCPSCAKGGRTVHTAIQEPCPLMPGKIKMAAAMTKTEKCEE